MKTVKNVIDRAPRSCLSRDLRRAHEADKIQLSWTGIVDRGKISSAPQSNMERARQELRSMGYTPLVIVGGRAGVNKNDGYHYMVVGCPIGLPQGGSKNEI